MGRTTPRPCSGCAAARARPRHDAHRHRRDVRRRGRSCRRGDRRPARRGVPRLQGAAAERLPRAARSAACERSLERLGTDRLDCYLLHWRGSHPLEDTFAAFEELKRPARSCPGASATSTSTISTRRSASPATGSIACNQVLYHLQERAIEHAVHPVVREARRRGRRLQPVRPRRLPRPGTAGGRVLQEIAAAHGATPRQVALAFLTRRRRVFAIPKASSAEHVAENAAAGDLSSPPPSSRGSTRPFRAAASRAACR